MEIGFVVNVEWDHLFFGNGKKLQIYFRIDRKSVQGFKEGDDLILRVFYEAVGCWEHCIKGKSQKVRQLGGSFLQVIKQVEREWLQLEW